MSSKRLPGKVLMDIKGKPIIDYLLDQVGLVEEFDKVVILTSRDSSDDPIVEYCNKRDVLVYRGSLENVAERFVGALHEFSTKYFVRLNADSPLYHREIMKKGVSSFFSGDCNFTTNVNPRTYPKGMGFEMISSQLFLENFKNFQEPDDFEHVLKYFYRNDNFKINNFSNNLNLSDLHFAVDTLEDFRKAELIINKMQKDHLQYSWEEYEDIFTSVGRSD